MANPEKISVIRHGSWYTHVLCSGEVTSDYENATVLRATRVEGRWLVRDCPLCRLSHSVSKLGHVFCKMANERAYALEDCFRLRIRHSHNYITVETSAAFPEIVAKKLLPTNLYEDCMDFRVNFMTRGLVLLKIRKALAGLEVLPGCPVVLE